MKVKKKRKNNSVSKNKSKNKKAEEKINFILEFRTLKHLPRGCLPFLKGGVSESIAEHSFYTGIISWVLSHLENADKEKAIKMALIHDLPEARGGERNLINKFYAPPLNDKKIIAEISQKYHLEEFFLSELIQEFNEEKTLEARIVRDADVLAQMLLEKESFDTGNFKAKRWLSTSLKRLKTQWGKKLGEVLYEIDSDKWWLEIIKKYILKTKFLSSDDPFFHLT